MVREIVVSTGVRLVAIGKQPPTLRATPQGRVFHGLAPEKNQARAWPQVALCRRSAGRERWLWRGVGVFIGARTLSACAFDSSRRSSMATPPPFAYIANNP